MRVQLTKIVITFLLSVIAEGVLAHGGGLDANGCHFQRSTGEYHCHRGNFQPPPKEVNRQPQASQGPNNLYSSQVDNTCYTGPRGGRYRIVNGKKRYGC
ncbi:YHYH domain-containing protein [Azonexus sp. IMCC34842]|uniref:YHYH domain-containing protein n=1 Tax=Azonexus sp. IMCC34842 TaxID=3420950 RepID=UPI003D13B258